MVQQLLYALVAGISYYASGASEAGGLHEASSRSECSDSFSELAEELLVQEQATSLLQHRLSPIEVSLAREIDISVAPVADVAKPVSSTPRRQDEASHADKAYVEEPRQWAEDELAIARNSSSLFTEESIEQLADHRGALLADIDRLRPESIGNSRADSSVAIAHSDSDNARSLVHHVQAIFMAAIEVLSGPPQGTYTSKEGWGDILEHIADDPRELQTLKALRKFQREADEAKRLGIQTRSIAALDESAHARAAVGDGLTESILLLGCGMVAAAFLVLAYHYRWDWQEALGDVKKDPQLLYKQFEEEGQPCC